MTINVKKLKEDPATGCSLPDYWGEEGVIIPSHREWPKLLHEQAITVTEGAGRGQLGYISFYDDAGSEAVYSFFDIDLIIEILQALKAHALTRTTDEA